MLTKPVLDPFLSTADAAEWLTDRGIPCANTTVRNWCRSKRIAHVESPGGRYRVRESTLAAMLTSNDIAAHERSAAA